MEKLLPCHIFCHKSFLHTKINGKGYYDKMYLLNRLQKYINTKFFHLLVAPLKISQHATQSVYRLVPLQNFTSSSDIDWNKAITEIDQQLYIKYSLTDEEIAFIESMIKPMWILISISLILSLKFDFWVANSYSKKYFIEVLM